MKEQLAEILAPYQGQRGATVPILQKVQEKLGYVPEEAASEIAFFLGISPAEVFGVVTFYAQFRTTPIGRNRVLVCRGTACHVRGGPRILEAVQRKLGIEEGGTTPDLGYSLETVACIGCCALAPTMVINDQIHAKMTPQKAAEIFSALRKEE